LKKYLASLADFTNLTESLKHTGLKKKTKRVNKSFERTARSAVVWDNYQQFILSTIKTERNKTLPVVNKNMIF